MTTKSTGRDTTVKTMTIKSTESMTTKRRQQDTTTTKATTANKCKYSNNVFL